MTMRGCDRFHAVVAQHEVSGVIPFSMKHEVLLMSAVCCSCFSDAGVIPPARGSGSGGTETGKVGPSSSHEDTGATTGSDEDGAGGDGESALEGIGFFAFSEECPAGWSAIGRLHFGEGSSSLYCYTGRLSGVVYQSTGSCPVGWTELESWVNDAMRVNSCLSTEHRSVFSEGVGTSIDSCPEGWEGFTYVDGDPDDDVCAHRFQLATVVKIETTPDGLDIEGCPGGGIALRKDLYGWVCLIPGTAWVRSRDQDGLDVKIDGVPCPPSYEHLGFSDRGAVCSTPERRLVAPLNRDLDGRSIIEPPSCPEGWVHRGYMQDRDWIACGLR